MLGDTFSVLTGRRYYSPVLGRWVNRDPIKERGGLNVYGFVLNAPLCSHDVLGFEAAFVMEMATGNGLSVSDVQAIGMEVPAYMDNRFLGIPDFIHVFAARDALPAEWPCIQKWLKKHHRDLWNATVGTKPPAPAVGLATFLTASSGGLIKLGLSSGNVYALAGGVIIGIPAVWADIAVLRQLAGYMEGGPARQYLATVYTHLKASSTKEEAFERIITSVGRRALSDEELRNLYGPWSSNEELLQRLFDDD